MLSEARGSAENEGELLSPDKVGLHAYLMITPHCGGILKSAVLMNIFHSWLLHGLSKVPTGYQMHRLRTHMQVWFRGRGRVRCTRDM